MFRQLVRFMRAYSGLRRVSYGFARINIVLPMIYVDFDVSICAVSDSGCMQSEANDVCRFAYEMYHICKYLWLIYVYI